MTVEARPISGMVYKRIDALFNAGFGVDAMTKKIRKEYKIDLYFNQPQRVWFGSPIGKGK